MIKSHTLARITAIFLCLVAGCATAGELVLSNDGGWRVILNTNTDNSFNRCILQSDQTGKMLRLAYTGKIWSLSVPASGHKNGADGTIGFNKQQPEFFAFSANKERAWVEVDPDTVNFMRKAKSLEVDVGKAQMRWMLNGHSEAINRVLACNKKYNF